MSLQNNPIYSHLKSILALFLLIIFNKGFRKKDEDDYEH